MTHEQQRVAIREACGWKGWYCTKCKEQVPPIQVTYDEHHSDPDNPCGGDCEPSPDYCNDLNAIHEAVISHPVSKPRHDGSWDVYGVQLLQVVARDNECELHEAQIWAASAGQCAEAFLRTLNLWKDV